MAKACYEGEVDVNLDFCFCAISIEICPDMNGLKSCEGALRAVVAVQGEAN